MPDRHALWGFAAIMNLGWPELITVVVTFASVVAVVLLHYEGLSLIGRTIKARAFHHRAKILMLIFAQLGSGLTRLPDAVGNEAGC